jgi:hypothetical protein
MGGYWVIHESSLMDALKEAAAGGNPDIILMELFANSEPGDMTITEDEDGNPDYTVDL